MLIHHHPDKKSELPELEHMQTMLEFGIKDRWGLPGPMLFHLHCIAWLSSLANFTWLMKFVLVDFYFQEEIIKWKEPHKRREAEHLQKITFSWQ